MPGKKIHNKLLRQCHPEVKAAGQLAWTREIKDWRQLTQNGSELSTLQNLSIPIHSPVDEAVALSVTEEDLAAPLLLLDLTAKGNLLLLFSSSCCYNLKKRFCNVWKTVTTPSSGYL